MTMGDELPVTSLVLPVLIRPVLTQLEKYMTWEPHKHCELLLPRLKLLYQDLTMIWSLGTLTDAECVDLKLNRSEEAFQELNKKSASLKKILSRIPDEITDRKTFLEKLSRK
ncbi:unnamed protein product [Danaus chrysippus]|uniref:(African queen) hypothetical protein n=1 Tax=Danaus chrysippus TaxID=151541 RepID=A0A8J2VVF5_9NEOP|nr:unnamed protein product [Danaus chrysippus]